MDSMQVERFIQVEERCKSNTHRLDNLEKLVDAVNQQNKCIAELVVELRHMNDHLKAQDCRLAEVEKIPKTRWNQVVAAIIASLIGGLIGAIAGKIVR
jgi:uncharacterized coiled-coil protein SlyX